MYFSQFDNRRSEKRSTVYMLRVAQSELLGIRLYKSSSDEPEADFRRSNPLGDDYVSQQEKYWASRLIWC